LKFAHLLLIYFCIAEAAAKKGGKGAKKDRSPTTSAAKKGSPKATAKKGKKGKKFSIDFLGSFFQIFQKKKHHQLSEQHHLNHKDHHLLNQALKNGFTFKNQSIW